MRSGCAQTYVLRVLVLMMLAVFLLFVPLTTRAQTGVTVVFFSGLCVSGRPDSCTAAQQAQGNIGTKLPAGTKLITPNLVNGAFADQGSLNSTLASIGSDNVVLIAFSAGYKGLWQIVQSMSTEQLQRVRTMVSLEAEYSGWTNAVSRVRSANPNVIVRSFSSSQFGTNHDRMPGTAGIGDAISALALAAQNGDTTGLAAIFTTGQVPQIAQAPTPQQLQTQLNALYTQVPQAAPLLSALPQILSAPEFQQAFQSAPSPQQIASFVQGASQALPSVIPAAFPTFFNTAQASPQPVPKLLSDILLKASNNTADIKQNNDVVKPIIAALSQVAPTDQSTFGALTTNNANRSVNGVSFEALNGVLEKMRSIMSNIVNLLRGTQSI